MSKLIGGDLTTGMSDDVFKAIAQAGSIKGDEKLSNKERQYQLRFDVWPPFLIPGSIVEFEGCTLEEIKPGDFIAIRSEGSLTVARAIKWTYRDGGIKVEILRKRGDKKIFLLDNNEFFGRLVSVIVSGSKKVVYPNKRSFWTFLDGLLSNYGAGGFFSNILSFFSENFLKMTTKKKVDPNQEISLVENFKRINENYRKEQEYEERTREEREKQEARLKRRKLREQQQLANLQPDSWWTDKKKDK